MTDDVFQKHVTALAVKRLEKPKKMSAQNAKYWSEIVNQLYNFHRGAGMSPCCLYKITIVTDLNIKLCIKYAIFKQMLDLWW